MAVILAYPVAERRARDARAAAGDIEQPPCHRPRSPSLLLLGLVPLLLANASWDAVTFLGGTGAHALPAHASSTCA